MPLITRLMLQNFKKFPELDLRFSNDRNILVGDNESGKSTILLALDLVLSTAGIGLRRWGWNRSCHSQQSGIFRKVSAVPISYPC